MFENVSRRNFLQVSAAGVALLGLAGCNGGGSDGGSEGGEGGSGSIKVGIMGPHTGDNSSYGLACLNGAQLYFKQLNADGGVNGKQIETVVYDEKGDATEAVNAYNRLVQEDGVTGIVGDVTTGPTIAVAQASVADNMPCVTPSATAADVVTYGSNYFRACVTDPEQGRVMANFAVEQGYKNVATLYLNGSDYSEGVNDAFVEEAQAQGITITAQESYSEGDVDFNTQLTNIINTNPDAILVPNYYQDDGMIVTQARAHRAMTRSSSASTAGPASTAAPRTTPTRPTSTTATTAARSAPPTTPRSPRSLSRTTRPSTARPPRTSALWATTRPWCSRTAWLLPRRPDSARAPRTTSRP